MYNLPYVQIKPSMRHRVVVIDFSYDAIHAVLVVR